MTSVRIFAASALACAAAMIPSLADAQTVSATLTGGRLSLVNLSSSNAGGLAFTPAGGANYTAALPAWKVVDATGSGDGWHVSFQSSPLLDANGVKQAPGSLTMSVPAAHDDFAGQLSPQVSPTSAIDGAATAMVSAAPNTGMGTFTFGSQTIPGATLTARMADGKTPPAQTITLTVTLASGPAASKSP